MIVRNECKIIERCLASVADHVACWVICDTGSTDGTQDLIRAFFAARGIPGELHEFAFENFGQARNEALARARASTLAYDYLLLTDADMDLVVRDPSFRSRLTETAYSAEQRNGSSYWNNRLLARNSEALYQGATHEFLSVGGIATRLRDISFVDHASGSNRGEKIVRDTGLLTQDLERDPDNPRSHFYLAQTYREAGDFQKAADHYARRAALGGWAEEAWYAVLQQARCLRDLGDDDGFQRQALAAYNARPHRAEPLYELARFHRQARRYDTALLFCEAGLALPWPDRDVLFIETFIYRFGLQEEHAIAGYYASAPSRRERGRKFCHILATAPDTPPGVRRLARRNMRFYAAEAGQASPSLRIAAGG